MKFRVLFTLLALAPWSAAFGQVNLSCSNTQQSPDTTLAPVSLGTVITLTVDTTGAENAEINGVPMTPNVDPTMNSDVTWSATYVAIQDEIVAVTAFAPQNVAMVQCTWNIDVIEVPPTFSKDFAPASIASGDVSTLTLSISSTSTGFAASSLDFTDNFPAGLVVANPANASTTCTGGTLTAVAGASSVSYTGGSIGAFATCTVSVDTTAAAAGTLVNTTGNLTSSVGDSGTANATLQVTDAPRVGSAPVALPSLNRIGLVLLALGLFGFGLRRVL